MPTYRQFAFDSDLCITQKAPKAQIHQRIIKKASVRFRRTGIGATGLQPLTKRPINDRPLGVLSV
ncbi:hypothetical protein DYL59_02705 [Pseudomonas kairouanensis]|uniref:Uncharacterized protein n=1 Tax=Pseudomonas kairouanensis TaxID=2293832 RepID=A0A4Z0AZ11_9PSED|nr:hypothetical protein DYL59_02705 [Pseudomonas kairouanensis]